MYLYKEETVRAYEEFASKMANLKVLQKVTHESFKKEVLACMEYSKGVENIHPDEQLPLSIQNMFFYCLKSGEARLYGHSKVTIQEQKDRLFHHKNKQYQWLLAEAYEIYADFLESLYACAGYSDNNLWAMSDFGSISCNDINGKDLSFYNVQASKKKDRPKSILNQFRRKFPEIQNVELDNKHGINLQLTLSLIQNFRHIIVHENGIVKDKKVFLKKVLTEACLYNGGNYNEKYLSYINQFFGGGEHANLILLLEKSHETDFPIQFITDRLGNFISLLVAHSALITEELLKHITKQSR